MTPATAPSDGNSDPANQAIVSLAQEFGSGSAATVVAGPSGASGPGSAISAVRSSGAADDASTVDNADQVSGQIVVVQALEQQMNGHKPGNYGIQSDANSVGPSPAPTPSVSPSVSTKTAVREGEEVMANARRAVAPAVTAVIAAAVARAAYTALTRSAPGGAARWARTNHRGEPVTLLEGPAAALAGAAAAAVAPGIPARSRAALVAAATGAAAFGGYDDIAGSGDRRGFRGHLGALAHGEVTTGAVKIGGIGATGVAAAALNGGPAVDVVLNAALIAGSANLLNLFDLRPGRALKVALVTGIPLGIGSLVRRGAVTGRPVPAVPLFRPAPRGPRR